MRVIAGRPGAEETDHRHQGLLRAHRQRPCDSRAAEKRDELAPPHVLLTLRLKATAYHIEWELLCVTASFEANVRFRWRIQLIDATPFPSNLARWNDMHMEGHAQTWFTPKQKAELWERWKSGQCVADIARALERRNKSGVYRVLALNGGIAPAPHRRAPASSVAVTG